MAELFSTLIFTPLYNGLILFIDYLPGADVGLAVILLTILVKILLFPLSLKAVRTQLLMKELEEPLKELQEKYKDDRQQQAQEMMQLYRDKGVNPFSSIVLLLVQLPIIFGLYWVFYKGGLPAVNLDWLYGFVPEPTAVNMQFLGMIDMAGRSVILALLAGTTQYIQAKYAMPLAPSPKEGEKPSFKDDLAKNMHIMTRYVLPVMVTTFAYLISAAVALYWVTSNIFTIGQEWYVRRHLKRDASPTPANS